jgi:hypothetical protein
MKNMNNKHIQESLFPTFTAKFKENLASEIEKIIIRELPDIISKEVAQMSAGIANLITMEHRRDASRGSAEFIIRVRENL